MSEMIERVAKALEPKCRAFGQGGMPMAIARDFARAAIEAMREPSQEMIASGFEQSSWDPDEEMVANIWNAMIDAALQEPKP